jgi:hypothetical protein
MSVRRVVTGVNEQGRAVVLSDGPAPRDRAFAQIPGMTQTVVWMTEPDQTISEATVDRTELSTSIVPQPGGTTLVFVTFPPSSVFTSADFDPTAAAQEQLEISPGLAERFEPDGSGKHTTDSVDYGILLDGELWVELDDGVEVRLAPHDVVVQGGARHSWSVRTEGAATVAFVLMGAER